MAKYSEAQYKTSLQGVINIAREAVSKVSNAYNQEWKNNPSTGIRAVLGYWVMNALRHYSAITVLCEENDLSMVANTHYRQMLEIQLQSRHFLSLDENEWEVTSQMISACGCIEFLEKLKSIKDHPAVQAGYREAQVHLTKYDPNIVKQIKSGRSKRQWYWFGHSFSDIASSVSRDGEDLKTLYQLQSADMHGSWGLTFGVANPKPGALDFRGYPDKSTMFRWAAELVDRSTHLYIDIWNEIATAVGAPTVS